MNKFIPLFLGLMIPLTSALADSFTDEAVEFCRSKGGSYSMASMVEQGDKYCRQVTCKKTNSDKYVINESDKGPEANVEATKQVCVAKSIVDGNFNTNGAGNSSGSTSGATSGSSSGSSSGATSGATAGASAGAAAGAAAGASGSASGASAGSGSGDAITCEELEGEGVIQPGGLCYSECKPKLGWKFWQGKKEGFERKSCVECLLKYPGVYRVKKEYLPKDSNGKVIGDNSVSLGRGVTVKTGVIVCKDANGKVVSVTGSACPTGMTIHTTSGSGSGSGTIIVAGGASSGSGGGIVGGVAGGINIGGSIAGGAGAGGGVQLPAYCNSSKQKDIDKCQEWMSANRRFLCSSSSNPSLCLGGEYNEINARYSTTDCVNCQAGSRSKQSTLSGIAEIVGAAAPIVSTGLGAYFGYKSQKAWAGAAEAGFEQCRLAQNDYMQYLQTNELPGLTPAQQASMNCNGYNLNQYAGMGGGMNGWYGAGYTPGFIGGMLGPYGNYNPYGQGGYVGGAVGGVQIAGGINGGLYGGYNGGYVAGGYAQGGYVAGGYNAGVAGGFVNGISIAGGMNGGYNGGYATGYVAGGYAQGGYVAGGYAQGGYVAGGYNGGYVAGGYNAGVAGGFVNGISIAGGMNGGYNGGFQGGYVAGGYNGGYIAAGQVGGYVQGGYVAGGYNGGYATGYVAGGYAAGGYAGGYAQGGYAAGGYAAGGYAAGGYNPQLDIQGANYDRMMQQQGTGFQMSGQTGGYNAGYYPGNVGMGLNASLTGSFGGW